MSGTKSLRQQGTIINSSKEDNLQPPKLVGFKVESRYKIIVISEELEQIVQLCFVKQTPCQSRFHFGQEIFSKPEEPSNCYYVCVMQILVISYIEKHKKLSLQKVIGTDSCFDH